MLDIEISAAGTATVKDVIRELTDDTHHASFDAVITAKVSGKVVIDEETIRVQLLNNRSDGATINALWEDYGYENYRNMGLFGSMSTQWQRVGKTGYRQITVFSDTYELLINY